MSNKITFIRDINSTSSFQEILDTVSVTSDQLEMLLQIGNF